MPAARARPSRIKPGVGEASPCGARRSSAARAEAAMTRCFEERGRLTPYRGRCRGAWQFDHHGTRARRLAGWLAQRGRHGHSESARRDGAATGSGTEACNTQAVKIAKELHRPISS
jgi:hypothetical protein